MYGVLRLVCGFRQVLMGRDREEWLAGDAESRGRYTFLARYACAGGGVTQCRFGSSSLLAVLVPASNQHRVVDLNWQKKKKWSVEVFFVSIIRFLRLVFGYTSSRENNLQSRIVNAARCVKS